MSNLPESANDNINENNNRYAICFIQSFEDFSASLCAIIQISIYLSDSKLFLLSNELEQIKQNIEFVQQELQKLIG